MEEKEKISPLLILWGVYILAIILLLSLNFW